MAGQNYNLSFHSLVAELYFGIFGVVILSTCQMKWMAKGTRLAKLQDNFRFLRQRKGRKIKAAIPADIKGRRKMNDQQGSRHVVNHY